ncbi:MAG: hypothetical protein LBT53_09180 [Puniceicoccales bacterium]|jgi:hypothetical protein|nr:hypothetical protein [Puniceicoccales bacterium]
MTAPTHARRFFTPTGIFRAALALCALAAPAAANLRAAEPFDKPRCRSCHTLELGFAKPPSDVRAAVYWYWINDNISKEGAVADLHAMKKAGITRAYIGHISGQGGPQGNVKLFSPEWWEVLRVALKTATELDIEIGLFNSPGWSQSGGPWVKPQRAMRYLAASETRAVGPAAFSAKLPAPKNDFQDVKVLAFPAPSALRQNLFQSAGAKITHSTDINLPKNGTAAPVKIPNRGAPYLGVRLPAPASARSLALYFAGDVSANCSIEIKEGEKFRSVRTFEISRVNFQVAVGFDPKAPIVISFPEVKSDEYRLVFTRVRGNATIQKVVLSANPLVGRFPEKTLAKMYQHPTPEWKDYLWDKESEDSAAAIKPETVLDLSDRLSADGTLNWQVPAGEWIILRTGMTPTGTQNSPASPQGTGLEVDKMSKEHTAFHFDAFLGEIIRRIPAAERKSFKIAVLDSYETGGQNFTDGFIQDFKQRYGYDPVPYLPAYYGHAIGSPERSDRFLWDVRRMVADKVAYDYVGGLRAESNKHGLTTWLENYGHWGFPAEFLQYGGQSDEVGGEFWSEGNLGSMENRAAASAAHIYNKKRVWSESFTSGGAAYKRHPALLKRRGDWSFTEGVNSTLMHVYIQQYDNNDYPGIAAWFGAEFNRKNAWFPHMDLFTLYLRRCNFILQQGLHVADVAYFIGEDTPKMTGVRQPEIPKGYNYDYINAEVILRDLTVKNGKLVLPHGTSYRVLVLPPQETIRPALLRKIEQLTAAGAIILGPPPSRSPSLQNYPAADKEVREIAAKLWGENKEKSRDYGKGKVFHDTTLEEVFKTLDLPPDCAWGKDDPILQTHRAADKADIYFITNQSDKKINITPQFRVTGRPPELWDPVSGSRRKLPAFSRSKKTTAVPLQLEPAESVFVVFRGKEKSPSDDLGANYPKTEVVAEATAPWQVKFDSGEIKRGPAEPVTFERLQSWSEHADERIRYYSGEATYKTTIKITEIPKGQKLFLDLGKVSLLAKIKVNGADAGGVWTPPYRVEITSLVKVGVNEIEVEVVNNWTNRLIGDTRLPSAQRKLHPSAGRWSPNAPLEPSGLFGPVRIIR